MEERKVTIFRRVFDRKTTADTTFEAYAFHPEEILTHFGDENPKLTFDEIKLTVDKQERNRIKKDKLPAMTLEGTNLLCIDIDGIPNEIVFSSIVLILSHHTCCYMAKRSVSGNICAFFKYDCSPEDYQYLYYKLYLELTLLLGVNIDFLPEIGRLRYLSEAGSLYYNEDSDTLTEILKTERLPYIETSPGKHTNIRKTMKTKGIRYGSR